MSNAFEVAVGNMLIHMVRRMSLVDNVNIKQDGGTSAAFDMNDEVEVKETQI